MSQICKESSFAFEGVEQVVKGDDDPDVYYV